MTEFTYSNLITKSEETDDGKFLFVPISSLSVDRQKDRMSEKALERMQAQIRSGTIAMHNQHGYSKDGVRYHWKDILGQWVDAERQGDILYAKARINEANPDAVTLWKYVHEERMPVGFSIGGRAAKGVAEKSLGNPKGFNVIDDIELLEVSAVGIPANQDAVVKVDDNIEDAILKAFGETMTEEPVEEPVEQEPDYKSLYDALRKEFDEFKLKVDESEQKDYAADIEVLKGEIAELRKELPERKTDVSVKEKGVEDNDPIVYV